ncbi:MAG: hypothetical protein Q4G21_08815 [Dermabacter sp.]|nr:hypothetical protein [Dermabacter sp.]
MTIFRRIVLPVLWLVVALVVAAALAKLAFFSGANENTDTATPSASIGMTTTMVSRGSIDSVLTLSGTVQRDAGTPVTSTQTGEINYLFVKDGAAVKARDKLYQIRVPIDAAPAAATVGEPIDPAAAQPAASSATQYRYFDVRAEADGTLTGFTVKTGQQTASGDKVAEVTPGTFSIVADLTPSQQYQLLDRELSATAVLPGMAEPLQCAGTKVGEKPKSEVKEPAATTDPNMGDMGGMDQPGGGETSLATLTCPIPQGTKTVPGLAADISVDTGSVADVLVVPTTAVLGEFDAGTVYALDADTGEQIEIPVGLGLRGDGIVEITSGLEDGQEILEYAPGVSSEGGGW